MIIEAAYLWVGFLGVAYILWKGTFLFCRIEEALWDHASVR